MDNTLGVKLFYMLKEDSDTFDLGCFKVTESDLDKFTDIDLWGNEKNNEGEQLTILVSHQYLYDEFRVDDTWQVFSTEKYKSNETGDWIFFEMDEDKKPTGQIVTL